LGRKGDAGQKKSQQRPAGSNYNYGVTVNRSFQEKSCIAKSCGVISSAYNKQARAGFDKK
jgi:hypothetical protein